MKKIKLHPEAILVRKELSNKEMRNVVLLSIKENYEYRVVNIGSEVKLLKVGDIIKPKEILAEKIEIDGRDFLYFSHGDSSFYYIQE